MAHKIVMGVPTRHITFLGQDSFDERIDIIIKTHRVRTVLINALIL